MWDFARVVFPPIIAAAADQRVSRQQPAARSSHLNSGTSVPREEVPWPKSTRRPVSRLGKTHVEIDERSTVTAYGGLDLVVALLRKLKAASVIDERVGPDVGSDHFPLMVDLRIGGFRVRPAAWPYRSSRADARSSNSNRKPSSRRRREMQYRP